MPTNDHPDDFDPRSGGETRDPTSSPDVSVLGGQPGSWDRADWQRIWLATQSRDWRTLALVPASDEVSTIEFAHLITVIGLRQRGESIGVADLRQVELPRARAHLEMVKWHVSQGERIVIALRSCLENLATIPLARAADCAILCVALGSTRIAQAEQTVEQIGKERFLGSVLVRTTAEANGARTKAPRRLRA
jgi:hypothetical protein